MTSPKIISGLVVGGFTLKWMCLRLYVTIWEREIPGSSQVELLLCLAVVPPPAVLCAVCCVCRTAQYSTQLCPSAVPLCCSVPCCVLCSDAVLCCVLCVQHSTVQYKKLQNPKIWFKFFQGIDSFWFPTHMSHRSPVTGGSVGLPTKPKMVGSE